MIINNELCGFSIAKNDVFVQGIHRCVLKTYYQRSNEIGSVVRAIIGLTPGIILLPL